MVPKAFRRFVLAAAMASLPLGASAVAAHSLGSGAIFEPPTSYLSAVRMIHDEMAEIENSRRGGFYLNLADHADWLARVAEAVPALAESLSAPDTTASRPEFMRVADSLHTTAIELRDAAARRHIARLGPAIDRIGSLLASLDAQIPKQYVCSMHCEPGKTYRTPGRCPVCGMDLQLITTDRYSVEVLPESGRPRAKAATTLALQLRDPAGFPVDHLRIVHEKPLHLMIVSQDLSYFDHVHPAPQDHGRFTLNHRFPAGGTYTLFHDFTPERVGMQVVAVDLDVKGPRRALVALAVDDTVRKRVHGYDVRLTHGTLAPWVGCTMTFTLTRHGKPVTDLEPFLGTMGHLVVVREDRAAFIHSHPLQQDHGPSVQFNMVFPSAGRYKAWGQFQRRGRVITVPFVIDVSMGAHSTTAAGPGAGQ